MTAEIYRAVVVTGNDPLGQGRAKITLPQISGPAVSTWATPTNRSQTQPAPGTVVWVHLDSGDPARPVYHSGPLPSSNGGRVICTSSTLPANPYPGMEAYETDTGNSVIYNGTMWSLQAGSLWSAWAPVPGTLGTNWIVHTAQYRLGPGGQVQVRGSMQKTVSPSATSDTLITLPSVLWPAPSAPDMWWPCYYQPGTGALGLTNVVLTTSGVIEQTAGAISFSGGNLSINLTPVFYSTL